MQNRFRLLLTPPLQQKIRLPVAPLVLLFRFHRQARQPGVQAAAIAIPQRHAHTAFHQRGGLGTHDGVIAPARLFIGDIAAHQSPRHNIAQLLGLILIELLRLGKGWDHQPGVFHVVTRHAGERHCRHLAGKIGSTRGAGKVHHRLRIVRQLDQRAGDGLILGGHLSGERGHQTGVARFHRQTDALQIR